MTIIEILNYVKKVINTTAEAAVNKINGNKFNVNFPEIQRINGQVDVKFPESQKVNGTVNVGNLPTLQKVEVVNQKEIKIPEPKEFPKEIKVSNFPTQKDFPKTIEVSNLNKIPVTDTKNLEVGIDGVIKAIEKLPKKFPEPKEIKFPEQKEVVIPDKVTVKNLETLKSEDPKSYVPVRLSDGESFYKSIQEVFTGAVRKIFSTADGKNKSALVDDDRHVQVDVVTMPEITIPPQTGGATEAKQDDIIQAIEDKIIPVATEIEVNNFPSTFPLPTEQIDALTPPPAIEGFSTESKQDLILTQLSNLITELQNKTEPNDIQVSELIPILRSILTVIANPSYVDKSANQMRAQVTGSLTTVTTVTNLSNIGSYSADHLQRMANINAWAASVRNLIT